MIIALFVLVSSAFAATDDLGTNGSEAPWHEPPPAPNSPTFETNVDNGDGTWTFTQQVDEASTSPNYTGPWSSPSSHGFEIYSWYNGDYGWLHTFSHWNDANLNVLSATLTIHAWDVDSEPFHGWNGEYDGIHVDATLLSPGYLQGTNNTWSTTVFDIPLSSIIDDGNIDVFMDIDMHHPYNNWATTLNYSRLEITYTTIINDPPYQPVVDWVCPGCVLETDCISGQECLTYGEDLQILVVGPDPADPDGDNVTYEYRWFVDIGTGGFIDDEFAGRGDHTGNMVPTEDTQPNDIWQVQVIPKDEHNAIGELTVVTFPAFCEVNCPFGSASGGVAADCPAPGTGLVVTVDIYEIGNGEMWSTTTDANGYFEFIDLPAGQYVATIITPLGYTTASEQIYITVVGGDTVNVDFALTCVEITASPRTIGFWKHQVGVATGGKGSAQIDAATLCGYLDLIEAHFNGNGINQVIIYQPPISGSCDDKLQAAKELLNLKGNVGMTARAKQQLMALLLNVASGKLSQTEIISVDGATVSQAITYCDNLIDDPVGDHETAKTICDEINNNRQVAAGVIPLTTMEIAYKQAQVPVTYSLAQNYHNPFNPTTEISFSLPSASRVKLEVFNVMGQKVATLVNEQLETGEHVIQWNGSNAASGVYFYRLQTGEFTETRKMMLLK